MDEIPKDKYGKPVSKGAVIKLFHFIGRRKKKHYMYNVSSLYFKIGPLAIGLFLLVRVMKLSGIL